MTGTPPGTPSLRRAVLVLLALVGLLATAGCVNLPANTTVREIGNQAKAGSGADVRIWPQTPQRDESAEQIVEGFLQTASSDPSNLSIAEAYLTGDALNWHPDRVVVFSDLASPKETPSPNPSGEIQVQITGTLVATVSDNGAYQQVLNPTKDQPYTFNLSYDKAKGYYRIDKLPSDDFGILLTQEAFHAKYAAYYLYYLNHDAEKSSMIPVPDYQRSQNGDAVTAQNLATALLDGPPPSALSGVAELAAPQIALDGAVTITPDGTASVPIKSPNYCTTHPKGVCRALADELLATFSNLASISYVKVVDAQNDQLAESGAVSDVVEHYHIAVSTAKNSPFYYLDAKSHQVYRAEVIGAGSITASPEQLGPENRKYAELAVGSFAQQTVAAAVDGTGTKLYVGDLGQPDSAKDTAPIWTGHHISSLTWDALGHLWFLDGAGTPGVTLHRVDMNAGQQPAVEDSGLYGEDGDTVDQIAVAPDGVRIAVRYSEAGSTPASPADSVGIGVIEDGGDSSLAVNLSYGVDQPVVNHWTLIDDVDWHGSQALALLGSQSSSNPLTIYELNTDGSPVVSAADSTPVTLNPPTGTLGIEWSGGSLLASTQASGKPTPAPQIEQYSFAAATWSPVVTSGYSPSYVY